MDQGESEEGKAKGLASMNESKDADQIQTIAFLDAIVSPLDS